MGVRSADTMTASGTGLLQFGEYVAGLRANRTFMRTLFSQTREYELQGGRLLPACPSRGVGPAYTALRRRPQRLVRRVE